MSGSRRDTLLESEMNRLTDEKRKLTDAIWDAEEAENFELLDTLQQKLVVLKIMISEESRRIATKVTDFNAEIKKKQNELAEREKEEKKKEKIEKKKKDLEQYYSEFEKKVEEALRNDDMSDVFRACNVPEQKFTLAVKVKMCKIYAWQKRQEVKLEKLIAKTKAYTDQKKDNALKLQLRLEQLGPQYSVDNMQKAIQDMMPDDEDDDYIRGQESESDDDMPRARADDEGAMYEGYSYESPYEYIMRLKEKNLEGNEAALRQLKVSRKQIEELNAVVQKKLVFHDKEFAELKKTYEDKTTFYIKKLDENGQAIQNLTKIIRHLININYLKSAEDRKDEELQKINTELKQKISALQEELNQVPKESGVQETLQLQRQLRAMEKEVESLKDAAKKTKKMDSIAQGYLNEIEKLKKEEEKKTEEQRRRRREEEERRRKKKVQKAQKAKEENENLRTQAEEAMEKIEHLKMKLEEKEEDYEKKLKRAEEETMQIEDMYTAHISQLTQEHRKLAINHNNIINAQTVKHDEEIAAIKRDTVEPLKNIITKMMFENNDSISKAAKFEREVKYLEAKIVKLKEEWDYMIGIKEHLAYKKGFSDAKIRNICEIAVQTDIVSDDYIRPLDQTLDSDMEAALDSYYRFRQTERADILHRETMLEGYNYEDANAIMMTKYLDQQRNKNERMRYIKWSEESVNDRYVRGSLYTGPIGTMNRDAAKITEIKYKYEKLLRELEESGVEQRQKDAEMKLAQAEKRLQEATRLESFRKREVVEEKESQVVNDQQSDYNIFKILLGEIDKWDDTRFYQVETKKFFSYNLSQWKEIYDSVFFGFKQKFYNVNLSALNLDESKIMFKLILNLNLLTGSRSHIWYGNHLNRRFNNSDFPRASHSENKEEYLLDRAQHTFFDWFGGSSRQCYSEMKNRLNTQNATAYKILLKTIGSTFLGRNFDFSIRA